MKDDSGKEYTLVKNGDGTETAKYDNGESVTFKRDDDGNLNFIAGAAGLLAGIGAGYLLWHGLSSSGAHYDSSTRSYRPSSSVSRQIKNDGWAKYDKEKEKRSGSSGRYIPSTSGSSSSSSSSTKSSSSSKSSTSKPSTSSQAKSSTPSTKSSVKSSGTTKSGFGSAGARSSAVS